MFLKNGSGDSLEDELQQRWGEKEREKKKEKERERLREAISWWGKRQVVLNEDRSCKRETRVNGNYLRSPSSPQCHVLG